MSELTHIAGIGIEKLNSWIMHVCRKPKPKLCEQIVQNGTESIIGVRRKLKQLKKNDKFGSDLTNFVEILLKISFFGLKTNRIF